MKQILVLKPTPKIISAVNKIQSEVRKTIDTRKVKQD